MRQTLIFQYTCNILYVIFVTLLRLDEASDEFESLRPLQEKSKFSKIIKFFHLVTKNIF